MHCFSAIQSNETAIIPKRYVLYTAIKWESFITMITLSIGVFMLLSKALVGWEKASVECNLFLDFLFTMVTIKLTAPFPLQAVLDKFSISTTIYNVKYGHNERNLFPEY